MTPQSAWPFPKSSPRTGGLIVDLFSGGGGASVGLEQALGRPVDIAINHDSKAVAMHARNHPLTQHLTTDIWDVCPRDATAGEPVYWLHASPDCTHHSQALGGQPRRRAIRSLSWVILRWAGTVRPDVISMENVRQIQHWGGLVARRCSKTGRVVKLCGGVAARGERVPIEAQHLVPCKRHAGRTWRQFICALRRMGYTVEWQLLRADHYGAPTIRERLFLIARRDGIPVQWPSPTHGDGLTPPRGAGECIDWTDQGVSIFDRPRPLADATMRRIARGIVRHVIGQQSDAFLTEFANASSARTWSIDEPLRTQVAGVKGGHFALVSAKCQPIAAFIDAAYGGGPNGNPAPARSITAPLGTITAAGSQQRVVTCTLAPDVNAEGAERVAQFLLTYYGQGRAHDPADPMPTVTTRDRLALVTVDLRGQPHVITDIRLRMLRPRELYTAQGFPASYIIDRGAAGQRLTITEQVRMCGNSVSPPPMAALVAANHHCADKLRKAA